MTLEELDELFFQIKASAWDNVPSSKWETVEGLELVRATATSTLEDYYAKLDDTDYQTLKDMLRRYFDKLLPPTTKKRRRR